MILQYLLCYLLNVCVCFCVFSLLSVVVGVVMVGAVVCLAC